jgi:type IV secretion system protein VirB1
MRIFAFLFISLIFSAPNKAFAGFWSECSVYASPVTMEKIVYIESQGNPYAIDDDTTHRSYFFSNKNKAIIAARYLINQRHNVDLGLAQINIVNIRKFSISLRDVFNPCYNVFVGSYILLQGYDMALSRFDNPQVALFRSLEYYNSGRFFGDKNYAEKVWEALN